MADRAGVVPQLLGAAVGIVLGATLLFALLGMLRDGDPSPEVVAEPDQVAATDESTDDADGSPEDAIGSPEDAIDDGDPDGGTDGAADDDTDASDADATADPEPAPEPSPEASEAPPAEQVDPAEISIQVLDAIGGAGGSDAANAVADELREAGYNVVVVNQAGRNYEVTTVFWSAGQEAGGRQVAAALGTTEAEQTPAEVQLSDSVDVHVVVGADRA